VHKLVTVNGPTTNPTLPVHYTDPWVSGTVWLLMVAIAVLFILSFVWTLWHYSRRSRWR
jgi:hypothetical protein